MIYYLNNILVYSKKKLNYKKYVKLILKVFAKVDSRFKLLKCEFKVSKTLFLEYVINFRAMSVDLNKIK